MSWSLSKILSFLQRFCVDESITRADLIDFISLRYDRVYNHTLKFYKTEKTFSLVSGVKYYYLDRELNPAIKPCFFNQTNDSHDIKVCDHEEILRIDSDEDETGTPRKAAYVELVQVQRQPNESGDSGTVGVKSSSADDTTQSVTISGIRRINGKLTFDTDEIDLSGTTFVASSKTGWHTFRIISKDEDTAGHVIVSDVDDGNVYSIIDPYSDHSEYQKWRFWPTSDVADTIKLIGFRLPAVPQNGSASLDVSADLIAGFIYGLRSDVHDINFDLIKAKKYEDKFEQALQLARENNAWSDDQILTDHEEGRRYDPRSNLEDVDEDIEVL